MGRYGAATVSFWLAITTGDPATIAHDTLKVQELTSFLIDDTALNAS